ncbi:MAG: hypothetical protein V4699_03425 [Patescibacteria group bacterium]
MKPITSGQQEQCVTVIKDAARKAGEAAISELSASGVINSENFQRVLGWGDQLVPVFQAFVKEKIAELAENIAGCLKLISGAEVLTLEPTDGKETIAEASALFNGWIDGDFKEYGCDVESKPTVAQKVVVHEMIKNGDFSRIFGGLSDTLDALCLTQPQIIQFVKKHRKWLRTDGYATFFLFKVGDEFFVARVCVLSDGVLFAFVDRFSRGNVWYAEDRRRVVSPQQ